MKFYQYPKCSTCRKAAKWLSENDVEIESIHIVENPPTKSELQDFWKKSGLDLKKFFNTSGGSYRELNLKDRDADLSDDERLNLLAADGKLIKRPIVVSGSTVLVGFKESNYETQFA